MNQPEGSIRSWRDLCEQFVNTFQGGYKRPGTMNDLYALVQEPNEMLRHFMQRFSHVSHNIPEAPDAAIITAFSANVRDVRMREKLSVRKVRTVNELYALADRCARAEEGRLAPEHAKKAEAGPASSGGKNGYASGARSEERRVGKECRL